MTEIAIDTIKNDDVLLGRGRFCYWNPGNVKFRSMIRSYVDKYAIDATRSYKSNIVQILIKTAQENGIRFLVRSKQDGNWYEAQPYVVQLKVSHALRDARNSLAVSKKNKKTTSSSDPKKSWKQSTMENTIADISRLSDSPKIPTAIQAQPSQNGNHIISPVIDTHIHKRLDKVKSYDSTLDPIQHCSDFCQSRNQFQHGSAFDDHSKHKRVQTDHEKIDITDYTSNHHHFVSAGLILASRATIPDFIMRMKDPFGLQVLSSSTPVPDINHSCEFWNGEERKVNESDQPKEFKKIWCNGPS